MMRCFIEVSSNETALGFVVADTFPAALAEALSVALADFSPDLIHGIRQDAIRDAANQLAEEIRRRLHANALGVGEGGETEEVQS